MEMCASSSSHQMNYSNKIITIQTETQFRWDQQDLYHFKFEEIDNLYWQKLMERNWTWVIWAIGIYLVTIYILQKWMKDRKAFDLRRSLFLWNSAIGIFSIVGFLRTAPVLLNVWSGEGGFYESICKKEFDVAISPMKCWAVFFTLSKFLELGDTIFIILRKRPVIFLQYYHHAATLFIAWSTAPLFEPISRWYIVLNFGVHSIMYPYFAARAVGIKMPVFIPNILTTIQLTQMIICTSVNVLSSYYFLIGQQCTRDLFSIQACFVVGFSFVLLWGNLFYDSVIQNGRAKRETNKLN